MSCKDFGTSTDPFTGPLPLQSLRPIKPPSKRPRLEQQEEEEEEEEAAVEAAAAAAEEEEEEDDDSLEGCSILASKGLDATYDSEDSVTALTESTVMS